MFMERYQNFDLPAEFLFPTPSHCPRTERMTRPFRRHQEMVNNIVGAIARRETDVRDILAAVTPGGGKSLLPVIAAARLIQAGIAERVCWIVPRDSLRLQAEEAFVDPHWRTTLGHDLTVRRARKTHPTPAGACKAT